jgi:hypothetical protein
LFNKTTKVKPFENSYSYLSEFFKLLQNGNNNFLFLEQIQKPFNIPNIFEKKFLGFYKMLQDYLHGCRNSTTRLTMDIWNYINKDCICYFSQNKKENPDAYLNFVHIIELMFVI